MRNLTLHLPAVLLACSLSLSAAELTGWFVCSSCKAANASSKKANRDCAESCIKGGAEAMFATESGSKLYKVANKKLALDNIKTKVKVNATIQGDSLNITTVEKAE
jgi:hypothetical protein